MTTQPPESNALTKIEKAPVKAGERGLQFSDMESMWRFCTAVVNSGTFKDINTPEVALIRLQAGLELGLTPIWSLTNIFVVNGKPSVYGDALLGIVSSKPDCIDVIESLEGEGEQMVATCEVQRKGRLPVKRTFSVPDAKRAGLWGKKNPNGSPSPWILYPQRMLAMRARSWACRDSFADALRGLGVVEEMRDVEPRTVAARVVEPPKLILPEDENQAAARPEEPAFVHCDLFHEEPACDDPNCWVKKAVRENEEVPADV